MWILYSLIGYVLLALVFILDKHILAQEVKRPLVYTWYSTIFLLVTGAGWIFFPAHFTPEFWLWSMVSGFAFGLALHTMFVAVGNSEASHLDPFIGAMITIAIFAGAYFWLGETFSMRQLWGIAVLGLSSLFLAIEGKKTRAKKQWRWYLLGVLSALFFAVSHLSAKFLYDHYGFLPGMIGSRFTTGIFGIVLLAFPATWRALKTKAPKSAKNPGGLVVLDKVLGIVAVLFIQYAVSISSVTVVNALSGIQYAIMFIAILILSNHQSKFLKEKFTPLEMTTQIIGLVLIILGLYLVV